MSYGTGGLAQKWRYPVCSTDWLLWKQIPGRGIRSVPCSRMRSDVVYRTTISHPNHPLVSPILMLPLSAQGLIRRYGDWLHRWITDCGMVFVCCFLTALAEKMCIKAGGNSLYAFVAARPERPFRRWFCIASGIAGFGTGCAGVGPTGLACTVPFEYAEGDGSTFCCAFRVLTACIGVAIVAQEQER